MNQVSTCWRSLPHPPRCSLYLTWLLSSSLQHVPSQMFPGIDSIAVAFNILCLASCFCLHTHPLQFRCVSTYSAPDTVLSSISAKHHLNPALHRSLNLQPNPERPPRLWLLSSSALQQLLSLNPRHLQRLQHEKASGQVRSPPRSPLSKLVPISPISFPCLVSAMFAHRSVFCRCKHTHGSDRAFYGRHSHVRQSSQVRY